MASLVAGYRPVHLTEEPLHTPWLPLRGGAVVRIRAAMLPTYYLAITPLQELATIVLTMARPEAIDRAKSVEVLRNTLQSIKDLGDSWSAAGPGQGSRLRK